MQLRYAVRPLRTSPYLMVVILHAIGPSANKKNMDAEEDTNMRLDEGRAGQGDDGHHTDGGNFEL